MSSVPHSTLKVLKEALLPHGAERPTSYNSVNSKTSSGRDPVADEAAVATSKRIGSFRHKHDSCCQVATDSGFLALQKAVACALYVLSLTTPLAAFSPFVPVALAIVGFFLAFVCIVKTQFDFRQGRRPTVQQISNFRARGGLWSVSCDQPFLYVGNLLVEFSVTKYISHLAGSDDISPILAWVFASIRVLKVATQDGQIADFYRSLLLQRKPLIKSCFGKLISSKKLLKLIGRIYPLGQGFLRSVSLYGSVCTMAIAWLGIDKGEVIAGIPVGDEVFVVTPRHLGIIAAAILPGVALSGAWLVYKHDFKVAMATIDAINGGDDEAGQSCFGCFGSLLSGVAHGGILVSTHRSVCCRRIHFGPRSSVIFYNALGKFGVSSVVFNAIHEARRSIARLSNPEAIIVITGALPSGFSLGPTSIAVSVTFAGFLGVFQGVFEARNRTKALEAAANYRGFCCLSPKGSESGSVVVSQHF